MAGFGFSGATASAYHPTLRDRAATGLLDVLGYGPVAQNLVNGLMGSRGVGQNKPGLVDFIPGVGQAFQADEAGRQMASGHPIAGAANLAMALPLPVATAAKAASKVAGGFARKTGADAVEALARAGSRGAAIDALPAPKAQPPIIAYHGSPYQFDKFDASKIGTGEGAQAYGHGLYFAENEGTARAYRDALKWRGTDWGDPESVASFWLQNKGGDVDAARAQLQAAITSAKNYPKNHSDQAANKAVEDALDLINRGYDGSKGSANPGSMYQVGINAHPDHFVDWDAPVSSQSPKIQAAIAKTLPYPLEELPPDIFDSPAGHFIGRSPEDVAPLREAGIPGIKYLDQGSRTAGDGTRNYVVFSPDHVDILKRYGIPATVFGGVGAAAAASQAPDQQQPAGL